MAERISNNIIRYNPESNFANYYRQIISPSFSNQTILGIPELPKNLPVSALDRRWEITKEYEYRVDKIAFKFYGINYIDYIWIILLYNKPQTSMTTEEVNKKIIILPDEQDLDPEPRRGVDPFQDFVVGREIYIPDRSTVDGRLIPA